MRTETITNLLDHIVPEKKHSTGVMSHIWQLHKNVLYLEVIDEEITWAGQEQQLDECLSITKSSRVYAISNGTNVTKVGREARKWANSPRAIAHIAAVALITPTNISRLIGNTYLSINRPLHPVKLFVDVESAYEWIMKIYAKDQAKNPAMEQVLD